MKTKIKEGLVFLTGITGSPDSNPLEARIFHTVCIATTLALLAGAVLTEILKMSTVAPLLLGTSLVVGFFYYLSRFKNQTKISISLYALFSNGFLILNYYYNSGMEGPTLLIFLMGIFMTVAIAPTSQYLLWISFNTIVVGSLLYFDYSHPGFIKNTYPDKESQYWDYFLSYFMMLMLVFLVTRYIRRAYINEKNLAQKKARELEEVNEKKNKLFSILAHDLSAPLTSIQGYLAVLSEIGLSEQEKSYIQKELLRTTNNTGQILTNVLSWIKTQMNGTTVSLVDLDLEAALSETLAIQKSFAAEKDIDIEVDIGKDLRVEGDKDMLQLVIRNLVNNAIKFSRPGQKIKVAAKIEAGKVIITVQDTGKGIDENMKPFIFSTKTQSTKGTKNEKGAGLGLVLCKEFTELQNGKIWFESREGNGTSFYISLPLARKTN